VECDQGCAPTSQQYPSSGAWQRHIEPPGHRQASFGMTMAMFLWNCTDVVEQSQNDVLHRHCHCRRRPSDRESPPEHRAGRNTAVVIPKLRSNDHVVRNAALEQPEEGRGGPQDQRRRPSLAYPLARFAVSQGRAAPWQNEEVELRGVVHQGFDWRRSRHERSEPLA
jgi:hypothetical protein